MDRGRLLLVEFLSFAIREVDIQIDQVTKFIEVDLSLSNSDLFQYFVHRASNLLFDQCTVVARADPMELAHRDVVVMV